jgi:hypothetical protein
MFREPPNADQAQDHRKETADYGSHGTTDDHYSPEFVVTSAHFNWPVGCQCEQDRFHGYVRVVAR